MDQGCQRGQEDEDAVHAEYRPGPKCPQTPRTLAQCLVPAVRPHADGKEHEVERQEEEEPDNGAHVAVEELLHLADRPLPTVLVAGLLRALCLAVAGNEPRLTDVQLVLGEELDQSNERDCSCVIWVSSLDEAEC